MVPDLKKRNWLWNYLGPFPQAAEGAGKAVGGEGEGEREGKGSSQRDSPGSTQLVFVQPRSWYSVLPQRPINGNRMSLWI